MFQKLQFSKLPEIAKRVVVARITKPLFKL